MIRKATIEDVEKILNIWLDASISAHDFIVADYWRQHLPELRDIYLPQAETFVYVDKRRIKGFISILSDNFIGGLFIRPEYQNKHIGSKLLGFIRRHRTHLTLRVYAKNTAALQFYQKNDFKIIAEKTDGNTGEAELIMSWAKGCKSGFGKRRQGDS